MGLIKHILAPKVMSSATVADEGSDLYLLLLAAAGGALMGTMFGPYSVLLQPAGIISGQVFAYPQSPMPEIYRSTASLGVQLSALLLHLGLEAVQVSKIINALIGACYGAAFAALTFAHCRRMLSSLMVSGAILVLSRSNAAFLNGADYPISIFSAESYGILGFGFALMTLGLLGLGRIGGAMLFLGLTVAMHPLIGAWMVGTVLCVFPAFLRTFGAGKLRAALPWLVPAMVILSATIAFTIGVRSMIELPSADLRYLATALEVWDGHRNTPFTTKSAGILIQASLAIPLFTLCFRQFREAPAQRAVALLLLCQAGLGILLYIGYHVAPGMFPIPVKLAIPARFLNFPIAAMVPVCFGMLLSRRLGLAPLAAIAALGAVALSAAFAFFDMTQEGYLALEVITLALSIIVIAATPHLVFAGGIEFRLPFLKRIPEIFSWTLNRTLPVSIISISIFCGAAWMRTPAERFIENQSIMHLASILSSSNGTVAVAAGLDMNKLPALAPYLIDTMNLDYMPYVPRVGPKVESILNDVYGINFFEPPAELRGNGGLLHCHHCQVVWQQRSNAEWQALRSHYKINLVVAPATWQLKLPLVWIGSGIRVYGI